MAIRREQLSKEQLPIVNLPLDRSYIVRGGPGTGKTWMAVFRTAALANNLPKNQNHKPLFLVYNRPLCIFIQESFRQINIQPNQIDVMTYHQWLWSIFKNAGENVKNYETAKFVYDWSRVEDFIGRNRLDIPHVILDEAQDFPQDLIKILKICSRKMSIFIDEHQAIEIQNNTKVPQIRQLADIESNPYSVECNYRNTPEIYDVARLFFTGGDGLLPERVYKRSAGRKPILMSEMSSDQAINYIVAHTRQYPQRMVGVVLPSYQLRTHYYMKLQEKLGQAHVQEWNSEQRCNFNFSAPGVRVLTLNTVKGLEFDTVFLCELDDGKYQNDTKLLRNQVYVSCTRAMEDLYLFCKNINANTFVLQVLNNNHELLESATAGQTLNSSDDDIPF